MLSNQYEIKIRAHETFYIREGWLTKGLTAVEKDGTIFSNIINAVDTLGVGANMAKSIKYWLRATGLTEEERLEGGKREQVPTEFGKIVLKRDSYFEDIGTLFICHYYLVSNFNLATSWNVIFNKTNVTEMTKEEMKNLIENKILVLNPTADPKEKLILDDCNCIIKSYVSDKNDFKDPEDNMICPFTQLRLLEKKKERGNEDIIVKTIPYKKDLNELIVLYVILDNLNEKRETTINRLIEDENNIGKVFNLDKNLINEYVDILKNEGYLNVNRTAGLNTITIKENILEKYYKEL
jgi:hypothetical protein